MVFPSGSLNLIRFHLSLTLCSLQSYPKTCYKFLMEGFKGLFGHLTETTVRSFSWSDEWEVNHGNKTVRLLKTTFEGRRDVIVRLLSVER